MLSHLELIFLVDISGSMETADVDPECVGVDELLGKAKWTRHDNLVKIMKAMTGDSLRFDQNGTLPVYFFFLTT